MWAYTHPLPAPSLHGHPCTLQRHPLSPTFVWKTFEVLPKWYSILKFCCCHVTPFLVWKWVESGCNYSKIHFTHNNMSHSFLLCEKIQWGQKCSLFLEKEKWIYHWNQPLFFCSELYIAACGNMNLDFLWSTPFISMLTHDRQVLSPSS